MNRLQRGLLHQGLPFLLMQLSPIEMWIRKVLLKTRKCMHQHTYTHKHTLSLTNWKAYTFMHGFAKRAQTNTNRWHLLVHLTHTSRLFSPHTPHEAVQLVRAPIQLQSSRGDLWSSVPLLYMSASGERETEKRGGIKSAFESATGEWHYTVLHRQLWEAKCSPALLC